MEEPQRAQPKRHDPLTRFWGKVERRHISDAFDLAPRILGIYRENKGSVLTAFISSLFARSQSRRITLWECCLVWFIVCDSEDTFLFFAAFLSNLKLLAFPMTHRHVFNDHAFAFFSEYNNWRLIYMPSKRHDVDFQRFGRVVETASIAVRTAFQETVFPALLARHDFVYNDPAGTVQALCQFRIKRANTPIFYVYRFSVPFRNFSIHLSRHDATRLLHDFSSSSLFHMIHRTKLSPLCAGILNVLRAHTIQPNPVFDTDLKFILRLQLFAILQYRGLPTTLISLFGERFL